MLKKINRSMSLTFLNNFNSQENFMMHLCSPTIYEREEITLVCLPYLCSPTIYEQGEITLVFQPYPCCVARVCLPHRCEKWYIHRAIWHLYSNKSIYPPMLLKSGGCVHPQRNIHAIVFYLYSRCPPGFTPPSSNAVFILQ